MMTCRWRLAVTVLLVTVLAGFSFSCKGCTQPASSSEEEAVSALTDGAAAGNDTGGAAPEYTVIDPYAEDEAARQVATATRIQVGPGEARELLLPDGTVMEIDENTWVTISQIGRIRDRWDIGVTLEKGAIRMAVPATDPTALEVVTPQGSVGIRGTEFAVSYDENEGAEVSVFEGEVEATSGDGGTSSTIAGGNAARLTRREVAAARIRAAVERRWQDHRARVADRLIERFQLDIEGDTTPDLKEVLEQIPATLRERQRRRVEEQLQQRRLELREALQSRAAELDIDAMDAQERFAAARQEWIAHDDARRETWRQRSNEVHERLSGRLDELADTLAARGADTAAARFREAAERVRVHAEEISETLARTSHVEPVFDVTVGPAEGPGAQRGARRLLSSPAPSLRGDNPLNERPHTIRYRVLIGPAGFVNETEYVSSSIELDQHGRRTLGNLIKAWRFNAAPGRAREWRTLTIHTRPAEQ